MSAGLSVPQRVRAGANSVTSSTNANGVLTKAAPGAGLRWAFGVQLYWSYSGTPTGGRITVVVGSTTVMDFDITAGGPGFMPLPIMHGDANEAVVVTIYAGGSGVVGKAGLAMCTTESHQTLG